MIPVFQADFPPSNVPVIEEKGTIAKPWSVFLRALFNRTGQGTGLANQVNTAATGNIIADWNLVTVSPVTLPALTGGQVIVIQNASSGNLIVNAPTGATIDGVGSYTLGNNKMQLYWFFSASQIFSTQLA